MKKWICGRSAGMLVSLSGLIVSGATTLAQVPTGDLSERPRPPTAKTAEQLMTGHGVLMILIGVVLLALVVGATLIPAKRGHLD
ncbi:MAG: hypothetical protein U0570_02395 [Phycisphaerales bacterium]